MFIKCQTLLDAISDHEQHNKIIEVENGIIQAIYDADSFNQPGEIIDLGGLTVLPGLIDSHEHLGLDVEEGDERTQCSEPLSYIAVKGVQRARRILESGITTLCDAGEKDFVDLSWRRAQQEGAIVSPRLLVSGQPITRTGGHCWHFGIEADGVPEVMKAVRKQLKVGVDFIKIMLTGGMTTEYSDPDRSGFSLEEIVAITEEAHRAGKRVATHCNGGVGADYAIEAGVDSIDHGKTLTREQLIRMKEKNIALVVTYGYGAYAATLDSTSIPQFLVEKLAKSTASYETVISMARELGVQVVVGGDSYHCNIHRELEGLIKSGFTPMEALRCATSGAAKFSGIDDITGSIAPGKSADIIAVDGDPLQDIEALANVRFVMSQGKIIVG